MILKKKQIRKYKIDRAKLIKVSKHFMYVHENILIPITMQSRLSDPKTIKFRANFILKKEQSVVIPLFKAFSAEKIKLLHKILEDERARTDMYFSEHKRVVEIDEKDKLTEIRMKKTKDKKKKKKKKKKK